MIHLASDERYFHDLRLSFYFPRLINFRKLCASHFLNLVAIILINACKYSASGAVYIPLENEATDPRDQDPLEMESQYFQ